MIRASLKLQRRFENWGNIILGIRATGCGVRIDDSSGCRTAPAHIHGRLAALFVNAGSGKIVVLRIFHQRLGRQIVGRGYRVVCPPLVMAESLVTPHDGKLEGDMVEQSVKKPRSDGPNYKQVRGNFRNRVMVWQQSRSRAGLLLGLALFASASTAWADAIGNLQGSWVTEDSKCTAVFEKIAGGIRFKPLNLAQSGFVISGRKVTGPIAGCTISQVKKENDRFSALFTCADSAVSKKLSMTFRLIDATHFQRLNVNGDLAITYKKCSF